MTNIGDGPIKFVSKIDVPGAQLEQENMQHQAMRAGGGATRPRNKERPRVVFPLTR